MRQTPEFMKIQENMQPGILTAHGFIGDDTRNIKEIIEEDNKNILSLDLSHSDIADRLQYFTDLAVMELGNSKLVDNDFIVLIDDHRRTLPCPFRDNYKAVKRNTRLENTKLGKTIYWSDLNIHMIREHGFYEGKGSFFRIDTKEIAEILGLITAK